MLLKNIPTKDLIEELKKREEVECKIISKDDRSDFFIEGACTVR
ncbi:hypothetical protein [Cetobacterium sp.]